VVTQFLRFIRTKADQDLFHLTTADLQAFRDELSGKLSRGSCNVAIKIMRAAFNEARTQGLMDSNPAQLVKLMRTERFRRRPFTPDELHRVLAEADPQWKGMIAVALYTGFRLGDVASLDWQSINLDAAEISMVTGKTHRQMSIPIAAPLLRHLRSMENRSGPVFPEACETYQNSSTTSRLSKAFYRIMEKAGLVKHRTHESTGKGRSARRNQQELGFHALRHTATSLLKNANVSDAVARDIIGHETVAISASYTHIDLDTKREAIGRLPDFLG
jgi:integrase